MRRADASRREKSNLTLETKSSQVTPDAFRAAGREHPLDVFDKDEPRAGLHDDAPRVGPQVALIFFGEALAGETVRLTRDSANDAIHEATPLSAVEGGDIAPNRSLSQETLLHRCDQVRDGESFPLHEHDRASAWHCQLDPEVEPGASGA